MFKAAVTDPKNPLLLMGLTDGNIERLKADRPLYVTFKSFGVDLPGKIAILWGKTEQDIHAMFLKNDLIGPKTLCIGQDPKLEQEAEARARHNHILIAMMGLPRSGKSTLARDMVWPIVCPDAIRLKMHGQSFAPEAERFVWAHAHLMVDSLFAAGHKHVILDATNVTRKRRDEWKSKDYGLFFHHVDTPLDVCLERAKATGFPAGVVERMAREFEPLGADELRW